MCKSAAPLFRDALSKAHRLSEGTPQKVQDTLHGAMDPNGILAPRRCGLIICVKAQEMKVRSTLL